MEKRFGRLDVAFIVLVVLAMAVFAVSEVKLYPDDGPPIPPEVMDAWTLVNLVTIGILGFGLLSALGPRSPGGIMLFLAALPSSAINLEGLRLVNFEWGQQLVTALYPKSFPYGMLIFVAIGFAAAIAQLLRRRPGPERAPRLFILGCFGVNGVVAVLAGAIMRAQLHRRVPPEPRLVLWAVTALPVVGGLLLIYRMWAAVQDGSARVTPASAVGRLFIPFYNLYWMFVALPGYADDYNRYIGRHNLGGRPLARGPLVAYCVLALVGGLAMTIAISANLLVGLALAAALLTFGRKVFGDLCAAVNALPARA